MWLERVGMVFVKIIRACFGVSNASNTIRIIMFRV